MTLEAIDVRPDEKIFAISQRVGEQLKERRQTVAVAESSTGGLLGAAFTDVPGSSAYFLGGVIAYDNRVKIEQLGVPAAVIERVGAVSAETAHAMASGVKRLIGADLGLSITGVAGPGGDERKPAGLTFIGLSGSEAITERHQFAGSRWNVRWQTVLAALTLLNRTLARVPEGRG